jgi:Cu-Zn family superoxide dismutase
MRRDRARLTPLGLALPLACAVLVACSSTKTGVAPPSSYVEVEPAKASGQEAYLRSIGSAVTGKVRVIDRGDGATVLLSMINLPPGQYRIAFHQRPNCSSPNAFSAGPHWAPAGRDARDIAPIFNTNADGTAEASVHVRGLHAKGPDGVEGHSVVIYTGIRVTDAQPDVTNNRVACGVFEPARTLGF